MRIGIVLGTNDPETAWNAFRFGVTALKANHAVKVFLLNKGVEVEDLQDGKHDVRGAINQFREAKGQILACGTCLQARERNGSRVCLVSSLQELLKMVEESDKLLTFG